MTEKQRPSKRSRDVAAGSEGKLAELEAGLNALTRQCQQGRLYVHEWRVLIKCLGQYPVLKKTDPALFTLAHVAIADQAIIIAARLVDKHPSAASVYWLLTFAEQNTAIFPYRQNAVLAGVKADRQKLSELAPEIRRLTVIRHKHYAHLDKEHLMPLGKLFAKYPFRPDDAEELYMAIGGILNRYSGHLRNSATYMEPVPGEGHTAWLLGFLSKSLEAANTQQQAELQRALDKLYHITDKGLAIRQQISPNRWHDARAQIDALVYELYGLTEEEVRVVEGHEAR